VLSPHEVATANGASRLEVGWVRIRPLARRGCLPVYSPPLSRAVVRPTQRSDHVRISFQRPSGLPFWGATNLAADLSSRPDIPAFAFLSFSPAFVVEGGAF
jgi:hypothetical protein